ncbi:MAG: GDSL-type esterase/lipase family protein [Candidatus Firestonebacteria bacterium]|nr:GDSL-type esterase/lipase family protein [Candidatus Firestonebacteria bacterium]
MNLNTVRKAAAVVMTLAVIGGEMCGENRALIAERKGDRWEEFMSAAKRGNIDLLFFGDSITNGWNKAGRKLWRKYYHPLKAANFSNGGYRTGHIIDGIQMGQTEGLTPKVVVLMIGTNNIAWGSKEGENGEQTAEGVKLIVKMLREKLPDSKILIIGVTPRGKGGPEKKDRKEIVICNKIISKLADGKKIKYLDLSPKLVEKDGSISKDIMPDLQHFSEKAYQIWADEMNPVLIEMNPEFLNTNPALK